MSSVEVIRLSTFSSTVVVGSNRTVETESPFRTNAIIEGYRLSATSSTDFSAAVYTSSNKVASTYVDSLTATNRYLSVWPTSPVIYRDTDSLQQLHWSATNRDMTSSIVFTVYYAGG